MCTSARSRPSRRKEPRYHHWGEALEARRGQGGVRGEQQERGGQRGGHWAMGGALPSNKRMPFAAPPLAASPTPLPWCLRLQQIGNFPLVAPVGALHYEASVLQSQRIAPPPNNLAPHFTNLEDGRLSES
ncbi:hypothetical protein L345_04545 [Ophiophagus hannah]|uniref:Uncharacterized protein n=1 Tax=Ophiophagus hannah TaxID=8665 RepID=V8P5R3_OPHHA|nr:hypothetical protein L345_04545 [Ophiophagus hannah]